MNTPPQVSPEPDMARRASAPLWVNAVVISASTTLAFTLFLTAWPGPAANRSSLTEGRKDSPRQIPRGRVRPLGTSLIPSSIRNLYNVQERHHACAILKSDFPSEWQDLMDALAQIKLPKSHITAAGGRKSPISVGINGFFSSRGWQEKNFQIEVRVDGNVTLAPTHHVDYFKNRIAIETEWNNKDPFYDRDLTTFRLLFELNVLSAGVIITRADELQVIFDKLGKGSSYGASTTHMSKLIPRLDNRASGGCPVLAFGMTGGLYDPHS
jgi:hypothetical protein